MHRAQGRITAEQQVLHANMDELVHAGTGPEQRLDHQSVFALDTVDRLNEPLHFVAVQGGPRFDCACGAVRARVGAGHARRQNSSDRSQDDACARGEGAPE